VDLLASDEYWDPHAIAGLLKSFLRELPSSILTRDLHLRFLAVIGKCLCFISYLL
jgi:RalA-binding protein 1